MFNILDYLYLYYENLFKIIVYKKITFTSILLILYQFKYIILVQRMNFEKIFKFSFSWLG